MGKKGEDGLNQKQKQFCQLYIYDWNGTKAYKQTYKGVNDNTAGVQASRLLGNPKIQAHLAEIQKDLEKTAGISRWMVIKEHQKLAFSSIASLHNTWITRREFEELTEDEKSCIAEIQTQTRTELGGLDGETPIQVDYVKIKLYDKQKSLDSIAKMLGYNEPEKMLHEVANVKSFTIKPV